MRIGVLSDTHDMLRPEVERILENCDFIFHAGDISSPAIIERLSKIAPTKAVRGNNDRDDSLPLFLETQAGQLHICMAHKKKDLPGNLLRYDIAICGHTHRYEECFFSSAKNPDRRTMILNPGSCGPRRFHQPITLAVITADQSSYITEKVEIPHRESPGYQQTADIRKQIDLIIRDTEKGRTTEEIALKYHFDPAMTEQIARLYVTHPGINANGIVEKMGL